VFERLSCALYKAYAGDAKGKLMEMSVAVFFFCAGIYRGQQKTLTCLITSIFGIITVVPGMMSYTCRYLPLILRKIVINPLTPELNPSAQRCLPRFFTGDFNF
jgi:hypothetical protein